MAALSLGQHMEDFIRYESFSPGDIVPLDKGLQNILKLYAPHVCSITHARLLSYKSYSTVLSINDEVVVKRGGRHVLREAKAMQFLSKRLSLSIPKVLGVHSDPSQPVFLVTEFVKGESLETAWPTLEEAGKLQVVADLKAAVDEMRSITGTYIGSLDQGAIWGFHFLLDEGQSGPFENEEQFNEALLREFEAKFPYHAPVMREMLKQKSDHRIVFSHGDLQMKNIIVHGNRISGIVDWESAGFYPEYWEHATASLMPDWKELELEDWPGYLLKALDPYPVEAATISIIVSHLVYGH